MSMFHSGVEREEIRKLVDSAPHRLHFVGAGGVGVYPLALLSLEKGHKVSASDMHGGKLISDLSLRGVKTVIGHDVSLAKDAELLVYTLAAAEDDPEILAAEKAGALTVSRAEMLGALMMDYKERIGISGSHGKSTTAAMLDAIYQKALRYPTTLVGAEIPDIGLPIRIGEKGHIIYEACEYKDSFLRFSPTAAVYTSLELDHTDYFKTEEAIISSFRQSILSSKLSVLNADDRNLVKICGEVKKGIVTYGEEKADVEGKITKRENGSYSLKIRHASGVVPEFMLKTKGRYNAKNALGAAALALSMGISEDSVALALSEFCGIGRRLEYLGRAGRTAIYYDYAHHPTEIRCAIETLKESEPMPLTVIFRPHTYSRTSSFINEFARALSLADRVILLDVDPVREAGGNVSSASLASKISVPSTVAAPEEAVRLALAYFPSCIVLMGAADVSTPLSELKEATRAEKNAGNIGN